MSYKIISVEKSVLAGIRINTFEEAFASPEIFPFIKKMERIYKNYYKNYLPRIEIALKNIIATLEKSEDILTFNEMLAVRKELLKIIKICRNTGGNMANQIYSIINDKKELLTPEMYMEFVQILKFLSHDISNMLPIHTLNMTLYNFDDPAKYNKRIAEYPNTLTMMSDILRKVFTPANIVSLQQIISFPLGIITNLSNIRLEKEPLNDLNPAGICLVSSGLVLLRLYGEDGYQKAFRQNHELQLLWGLHINPTPEVRKNNEGIFLRINNDQMLKTYPNLFISIIYNSIKNSFFAMTRKLGDEMLERADGENFSQFLERLKNTTFLNKIRLNIELSKMSEDNLYLIKIRDEAQGFPLNKILVNARSIINEHVEKILDSLNFYNHLSLNERIKRVTIEKRKEIIEKLVRRTGLRNRIFVGQLFDWIGNGKSTNRWQINDVIEMASIFGLSGHDLKDGTEKKNSGFGLFGIRYLAPTAGVVYASYLIPDDKTGTETDIAYQSLAGIRLAESNIRSILDENE
ncbi:MAG: hypothetical protein PHV30_09060 [Candidatus Margulisbacteria bacterium]|nr:hypothetical protein [Candidatus Margulisiibacteriota bacterium]